MKHDLLKQFAALRNSLTEEKSRVESRLAEINAALGGDGGVGEVPTPFARKTRGMSPAGRARIVAAQKARWAKFHAGKGSKAAPKAGRRKVSAAGRARMAAAARARWRKAKKAGKNSLAG
jgi:hypothetical protein